MNIDRDVFENAGPNGTDVRLYWDTEREDESPLLPSVTSILDTRDEDKSGLHNWQDRNDGDGDNAYHKHLFFYKRHRGTLAHWYALKTLDPSLEWSPDEAQSVWALNNIRNQHDPTTWPETHDAQPREVLYSVCKDQHGVETWGEFYDEYAPSLSASAFDDALYEQARRDVDFFVEAFDRVTTKLPLDRVIDVETYIFDEEYEYAGQADLLYKDSYGDIVLADLKTSSGCYTKHKLQTAAYAKAVERDDAFPVSTVDRLEVIRIHPDTGQYAVHTSDNTFGPHTSTYWNRDYNDLWNEFADLATAYDYDTPT